MNADFPFLRFCRARLYFGNVRFEGRMTALENAVPALNVTLPKYSSAFYPRGDVEAKRVSG